MTLDDERALDAVATIWVNAVYWRPGADGRKHFSNGGLNVLNDCRHPDLVP